MWPVRGAVLHYRQNTPGAWLLKYVYSTPGAEPELKPLTYNIMCVYIGKPGGGPTQCKGSRGHSGNAQLHENGRLQRPNNEASGFSASEQF